MKKSGLQIKEILDVCEVKPAVQQTEVHPYSREKELKEFLAKENIYIQAWYPLGHGDKALLNEELFVKLGQKYGRDCSIDQQKRYYHSTPELLEKYVSMVPPVDEQK